ncbi:metallophosphoesterase [Corallococcus sp. H22C18031201]|uniref:metallophosphoesterase n=1 Tax=Citreicoccus inhibens TaxID=2849499 RepID=UPI000E758BA6|nr:metallophosphoesterase [Citreicoccus inhibens]MBU8898756.1 metallophosphoesterase [Citreicoccus inhibens]RJS24129.1 metallophosphoesterase [Corallococcus sp. H22C18031201]
MDTALRFVFFVLVIGVLTVFTHIYLYRRLFRDTSGSLAWHRAGKVLLVALCLPLTLSWFVTRLLPLNALLSMATVVWTWMGIAIYLLLTLGAVDGVKALGRKLQARKAARETPAAAPTPPAPAPVDEARRLFLARAGASGAVLATSGVVGYGAWRAFHPPVVSEVAVRLPGLPKALDGFTLVHLSDIHVGPIIQRRFMDELVARCNALKPDLVAITGDLVDGTVSGLGPAVSALTNLRSRAGTYFVTGNHEYYWNADAWTQALEGLGIGTLRNRHVRIGDAAASFDLVGVDDWSARNRGGARGYDLGAATAGRDLSRASVLLAHQPSNWSEAAQAGMGLQLSGHTHGGQFFPFTLAVAAIWRNDQGHFQQGENHLYVSRGTGFWGPPLRVGAPPEIVKVTLLA